MPQAAICQAAFGDHGPFMDAHIGITGRIVAADIQIVLNGMVFIYS